MTTQLPATFAPVLNQFEPVSLAQMSAVALMNRTDTKYVMPAGSLLAAMAAVARRYRVLDIDGLRIHPYRTIYFDTADFALYRRHHAGWRPRYKVRSREYVSTHHAFFEIKVKGNNERTAKERLETGELVTRLTATASDFVGSHIPLDASMLQPRLWNSFARITLVNKYAPERLTLDLGLQFGSDEGSITLPGLAIAEVKQEGMNRQSDFTRQMRAMSIRPTGFSKFCIGIAMLNPTVKQNNFKAQLTLVHQLTAGTCYVN